MNDTFNFEKAMQELSDIADKLERDDLPIDEAIKLFEKGLDLSKQCQDQLNSYETTVKELVQKHQGDAA